MKRNATCVLVVGVALFLASLYIADTGRRSIPVQAFCSGGRECWSPARRHYTSNVSTHLAPNASATPPPRCNSASTPTPSSVPTTLPLHRVDHGNLVKVWERSGKMSKMESTLAKFRTLLPSSFLPEYKNPCWMANYRFEHQSRELAAAFPFDGSRDPSQARQVALTQGVVDGMRSEDGASTLICLPAFFLPGYSKCGTTELFRMLQAHPDFVTPAAKELNWWTWKLWYDETPLNTSYLLRYFSHFAPAAKRISQDSAHRITGDMSVLAAFDLPFKLTRSSTYDDSLMFLVSSILPHSKIIFMMRDPVYKVRSAYYFFSKFGCPRRLSAVELHKGAVGQVSAYRQCLSKLQVDAEYECLFEYSRYYNDTIWPCYVLTLSQAVYYHSITLWMRHFPRDQLLFLRMEDLTHNATDMAVQVFSFLGLSPPSPQVLHAVAQQAKLRANANSLLSRSPEEATMLPETKALLQEFFEPFNAKLAELLEDSRYLWKDTS